MEITHPATPSLRPVRSAARAVPAGGSRPPGGAFLRIPSRAHLLGMALVALPLLLYVYLPRPPVPGSQFLAYPVMAGILGVLVLLLLRARPLVSRGLVVWLVLMLAYSIVTGASFIANASELRGSAPLELFRPVIFGIFLVYGYLVGAQVSERVANQGLAWAAALILLGQLVLAVPQLLGIPLFSLIYEDDKSRPFGLLLRVTGSLGNPNAFAWMVSQAAVVLSLVGRRRFRWAWLGLATLLLLVSGSRTLLLLFPFMFVVAQVLRNPTSFSTYARYLGLAAVLLLLFGSVIFFLGDYFPYLAQLQTVVTSGSLASVNSFSIRLGMWESRLATFFEAGGPAWIVGLGSRESTAVLDSDFLYVFVRLGLSGVFIHYLIVAAALTCFLRSRSMPVAIIGAEYLVFGLVFGLVAETLASWHLPLVLFALLGITLGLNGSRQAPPERKQRRPRAQRTGAVLAEA